MKVNFLKYEGNVDVGIKFGEFGYSLKELICCYKFEESGDIYRFMLMVVERGSSDEGFDIEEFCSRFRIRSLLFLGCGEMFENKFLLYFCYSEFLRFVSVFIKLLFVDVDD